MGEHPAFPLYTQQNPIETASLQKTRLLVSAVLEDTHPVLPL